MFLRKSFSTKCIHILTSLFIAFGSVYVATQQAVAAPKFSAIAVDARTGKILFGKNIDSYRYPASLTKIMTLYLLFEDIKRGKISLNTPLRVSRYAASRPPSKIGFKRGQTILVRHAILALVTKSANDVATAVAENLAGSEAAFARRMTATARRIGMTRTTFKNASGLPNRYQKTTARDMATLGLRLQRDFPRSYRYFSTRRFSYKGRRYGNHNRLLGRIQGVDGIKTGYTRASGFNLTSSVRRGSKRVVAVVMGGRTGGARNRYMSNLIAKMFKYKRLTSSSRIASYAGRPPGYAPSKRKVRVASVQKRLKTPAPLPRRKPVLVASNVPPLPKPVNKPVRLRKQQDRLVSAVPKRPVNATFKTAAIVDDIPDEIVDQDVGSKSVVRAGKSNMAATQPPKFRKWVKAVTKVKEKPLPQVVHTASTQKPKQINPHSDTWNIQIGAFPTKASASSRLVKATSKAKLNLRGKTPFTMEIRKDGTSVYRARFAGFNKRTAKRACRALSRKGIGCFALAPRS